MGLGDTKNKKQHRIRVWQASIEETNTFVPAGTIISANKDGIVVSAAKNALDQGLHGYTRSQGSEELCTAVCDHLSQHGVIVDAEDGTAESNIIQSKKGDEQYVVSTNPGLTASLGAIAMNSGKNQVLVSFDDIKEVLTNIDQDEFPSTSGYTDLNIAGLNEPGQSAGVLIPLDQSVDENTIVRVLKGDEWFSFVEDEGNVLYSAEGEPGVCPALDSDEYKPGLSEGHWCVQAVISDGSVNDRDENENGSIEIILGFSTVDTEVVINQLSNTAVPVTLFDSSEPVLSFEIDAPHSLVMNGVSLEAEGGGLDYLITSVSLYVDADNDGKVNLWTDKEDIYASAANFLKKNGWATREKWGREALIPKNFDYRLTGLKVEKTVNEWAALGVLRGNGSALPRSNFKAFLIVPMGHKGPAFLVYRNFDVIMKWNRSTKYALSVAHLSDRLNGAGRLSAKPLNEPLLSTEDIMQIQNTLNLLGYDTGTPDGMVGSKTRKATRQFQSDIGLTADGYVGYELFQQLQ